MNRDISTRLPHPSSATLSLIPLPHPQCHPLLSPYHHPQPPPHLKLRYQPHQKLPRRPRRLYGSFPISSFYFASFHSRSSSHTSLNSISPYSHCQAYMLTNPPGIPPRQDLRPLGANRSHPGADRCHQAAAEVRMSSTSMPLKPFIAYSSFMSPIADITYFISAQRDVVLNLSFFKPASRVTQCLEDLPLPSIHAPFFTHHPPQSHRTCFQSTPVHNPAPSPNTRSSPQSRCTSSTLRSLSLSRSALTHPLPPRSPSPETTVKQHIALLHTYNEIRDVGQGLLGMVAENRGVRIRDVYGEFGVAEGD